VGHEGGWYVKKSKKPRRESTGRDDLHNRTQEGIIKEKNKRKSYRGVGEGGMSRVGQDGCKRKNLVSLHGQRKGALSGTQSCTDGLSDKKSRGINTLGGAYGQEWTR